MASDPAIIAARRPTLFPRESQHSLEDNGSTHSRDSAPAGLNLPGLFGRRGSLAPAAMRPRTAESQHSGSSRHSPTLRADPADVFEMTAVPFARTKAKPIDTEAMRALEAARIDQEETMAKWRQWVVEQPGQAAVETSPSRSHTRTPSVHAALFSTSRDLPVFVPPYPRKSSTDSSLLTRSQRDSAQSATPARSSSTPAEAIYYNTESTRMLMDVELAVDPSRMNSDAHLDDAVRPRRLSSRPRLAETPNPFVDIDTILSVRGIRPLVLELLHSLGSYVDAVWCSRFPDLPCPWYRSEPTAAGVGASWQSWILGSVQEAKALGLLANPPTATDLMFWEDEVRYGLRDVDEAINRRSNKGWVFAQAVVEGDYGDVVVGNVIEPNGTAGNVARLLNDLEEALWGDAVPIPTDIAYECDVDFNPFTVYRQGDQLVGVEDVPQTVPSRGDSTSAHGSTPSASQTALNMGALAPGAMMSQADMLEVGRERHRLWVQSMKDGA